VPTPFYHLSLAEDLLRHPSLPEKVRQFLQPSRCAFLFGTTAPDVQVVSGQPRQQTHYFSLPIQPGDPPAWELLLSKYPQLAEVRKIPALKAAFLAGYLCHLQADWMWVMEIFTPTFGPRCTWGTFQERLYLHNVLRAYLDVRILPELHPGMDTCLLLVKPDGWLPFVKDHHLVEWRDLLFPQLQPGASTQTVEVFSSRQGISAPEFQALLGSEERMQQEVFRHLPLEQVQGYHQRVLDQNTRLISGYLALIMHNAVSPTKQSIFQGVQP
jgi:hypothetical protein